jgi:hypothetical protein
MDNGKISTVIITIAVIVLGVFVANPSLLQNMVGQDIYAQYGALIIAVLIAIYNYAKPRVNIPEISEEA